MDFPNTFFKNNRNKLHKIIGVDMPIVMIAHGVLQSGADVSYPFHQEANFWYLTGVNKPDVVLVVDKDQEFLILPQQSEAQQIFDGGFDHESIKKTSGVNAVVNHKEGWAMLSKILTRSKKIATMPVLPTQIKQLGIYTNPSRKYLLARIKRIQKNVDLVDLRLTLAQTRSVKQPIELKAIQTAIDITTETLSEVIKRSNFEKYQYEYEIEADIDRGFRWLGADGRGFESMIASGKRACTIHYDNNNAKLESNDLVIMDVGAQVNHYTADIARTVSINPTPSKRSIDIYNCVQEACDFANSLIRPGVLIRDYELKVRNFVGKKLKQLGLINTINLKTTLEYFPHATSHFLGLEPHDAGDYSKPLKAGMVLAVEPGIYIAKEGLGIRIENNVLVTKTGVEVLSANLPCSLT